VWAFLLTTQQNQLVSSFQNSNRLEVELDVFVDVAVIGWCS